MPLSITIVGGGLAGLATSISLIQHGHKITLLERRPKGSTVSAESGSGIQFQPNIAPVLEFWNLLSALSKKAHDSEGVILRSLAETGQLDDIARIDLTARGRTWFAPRKDMLALFADEAERRGVNMRYSVTIQDVDLQHATVKLASGETICADLIVGADGSNSRVRQALFPDYKAKVLDMAAFQIVVPLDTVQQEKKLETLLDGPRCMVIASPGRSIFCSPALHANTYDMQLYDLEFGQTQDPNVSRLTERIYDLSFVKERWSDHGVPIRELLDRATSAFKWRFVEVFGLPSWSSPLGKAVLLGDACHAMTPFAGQGSAMGIEDAAVLGELLSDSHTGDNLTSLLTRFEHIRRSRCETVQKFARAQGRSWAMRDTQSREERQSVWRRMGNASTDYSGIEADEKAAFSSPSFNAWLDRFDARKAVEQAEQVEFSGDGIRSRL